MKWMMPLLALLFSACMTAPLKTQETVDDRPTLNFVVDSYIRLDDAWVYIDGEEYGPLKDFLAPHTRLRIGVGKHQVEVFFEDGQVAVFDVLLQEHQHQTLSLTAYD